MSWESIIIKGSIRGYSGFKSKFWGYLGSVPNETSNIFNKIKEMSEEEKNRPEVQKDIKYLIALSKKHISIFEEILEELEWVGEIL